MIGACTVDDDLISCLHPLDNPSSRCRSGSTIAEELDRIYILIHCETECEVGNTFLAGGKTIIFYKCNRNGEVGILIKQRASLHCKILHPDGEINRSRMVRT